MDGRNPGLNPTTPSAAPHGRTGGTPGISFGGPLGWLYERPYLLLVLTNLLWAGNIVVGRAVADFFPPAALAVSRWGGAFLIVLPFAWRHLLRDLPVLIQRWRIMLLLSGIGIAAYNTIVYYGLRQTTAINGVLMQSTMPLTIVALTWALFRERPSGLQIAGILGSLAGVLVIVGRGDIHVLATLSLNLGDPIIYGAIVLYSAYSAMLRLRPPVHPLTFLAALMGLGTLMLVPAFAIEAAAVGLPPARWETFAAGTYVAVFPSVVAYWAYNRGVELIGANRAGVFFHLIPPFGAVMAIVFLGEHLAWYHFAGFALILGGVALASRKAKPA